MASPTQAESPTPVHAGQFSPALPADSARVLWLFVVAARAVAEVPEAQDQITHCLVRMVRRLVPPESVAAEACLRLWALFARVAEIPKTALRREAGRAFWRDLDGLAQRLGLPPLTDWEAMPSGIHEGAASAWMGIHTEETSNLEAARQQAQTIAKGLGPAQRFPAHSTVELLGALGSSERRRLLERMVGEGVLGRSDVNLLIRFMVRGSAIADSDTSLTEVLQRLGAWMAQL